MCPKRSLIESLGSGVTSLRELNWETTALEQQFRDTFSSFGSRMTSLVNGQGAESPLKDFVRERPFSSILIGLFLISCAFPIFVFLSFALITVGIGLISFLCIEGTIIGFALLILGSILLTVVIVAAAVAGFFAVTYFVIKRIKGILDDLRAKLFPQHQHHQPVGGAGLANGKVVEDTNGQQGQVTAGDGN